jgi:2-polyprenyl-6-methoxyphenol hydroxylase-like FAD-dependent oxidoreductase
MFDVIVIGARVAGAPTAMLLARYGYKVLLVDRASFPSDTLSTHQIQLRGVAALKRWGLLDQVRNTNCPPTDHASFMTDNLTLHGKFPPLDGAEAIICPRRTILDKILVDAAVQAGVELREDFLVEGLNFEGETVTGILGHSKSGANGDKLNIKEYARLVIGADGKHSLVAQEVKAEIYNPKPVLTCAYYSYWEGIELDGGEMYISDRNVVGVWPTNNGLTLIYTAYPYSKFQEIRKNIEASFWGTIDLLPKLADRVHLGRLAERFYGTADLPAFYRRSHGSGWVLVGDAGLTMDPVTGQGIGNAFRDAERMAEAIDSTFSGKESADIAFNRYELLRDEETLPMYEFTSQIAAFLPPPIEQQILFAAMARKPQAASRFLGALTGSVPLQEFFSTRSLFQIMGIRGMGRVFLSNLIARRSMPTIPGKPA